MKKRLLFATLAMLSVVSSFALEKNEYVYTPQGRFQITEANINANSAFADFTGWTVVSAAENKTLDETFILNANGYAEGINSVQSSDATATEGMYYKFEPGDANDVYVVSFKMKGTLNASIRIKTDVLKTNLVRVVGNSDLAYEGANDVVYVNKAEELTEDWQTFNYAIVGDGIARAYFISFTGMATDIQIADLQIAKAVQVADLRQRDAMLDKLNVYKNCYAWPEEVLEEYGLQEAINGLQSIGDESDQDALDEELGTANDILNGFLEEAMEDYLAGNRLNYFNLWPAKTQKASTWGEWTGLPEGRVFWENESQGAVDLGHYAGSQKWGDMTMGVYMQKEFSVGSYVFAIEGSAAFRENNSSSTWANNDGLKVGVATAYIKKVLEEGVEPTAADTLQKVVVLLDPLDFTPSMVSVAIAEEGKYEVGYKVVLKESLLNTTAGGVTYVRNASLWGKNENKYNQKELAYEADVREQITTGRNALTTAADYIADEAYSWGKAELQDSIASVEPKIAEYEQMDQDAIIATFEAEEYNHDNRVKNAEEGLLVFEVYDKATKSILAANKKFLAVNDTLNSIQVAIDAAKATLKQRIYDAATGKASLQAAIDKAKGVQAQMKAADYSEENAAAIIAANKELAEAVELFKTTIPASEIVELVSLDFENGATKNEETSVYEIAGNNTVMSIENFSETTPAANEKGVGEMKFELGLDSNGEKVLPGVLRVGNGSAVATIPAKEYGTNILKISMDFWFLRLSDGHVGFSLADENGDRVAGLYFVPYNNNLGSAGYDDFAIENYGSFFLSNTLGDAASCDDNNLSHIECILDYGEKSMYLVSTNVNGTFTSNKVAFNGVAPVSFTLLSNYKNYIGRRCWFDNLKFEQITAGEPSGVKDLTSDAKTASAIYTLTGVKAQGDVKSLKAGLYIINGKKYVVK